MIIQTMIGTERLIRVGEAGKTQKPREVEKEDSMITINKVTERQEKIINTIQTKALTDKAMKGIIIEIIRTERTRT